MSGSPLCVALRQPRPPEQPCGDRLRPSTSTLATKAFRETQSNAPMPSIEMIVARASETAKVCRTWTPLGACSGLQGMLSKDPWHSAPRRPSPEQWSWEPSDHIPDHDAACATVWFRLSQPVLMASQNQHIGPTLPLQLRGTTDCHDHCRERASSVPRSLKGTFCKNFFISLMQDHSWSVNRSSSERATWACQLTILPMQLTVQPWRLEVPNLNQPPGVFAAH